MRKFVKEFENPSVYVLVLIMVLLFCLGYWGYLYFSTEMSIVNDAVGYENAGRVVFEQGWQGYFETGPEREPFYIFTIAFSMKMGKLFGLNYRHFQKIIQVMLLFSAQLLLLHLLNMLRIHNLLKILTVLYFGISPGIVNGAFSLYCEIITYPFVLLAVILLVKSWQGITEGPMKQTVRLALMTGLCLLLLTLGKGIFRFISLIALLPFVSIFFRSLWVKKWEISKKAMLFMIIVCAVVNAGVFTIKALNEKYNGHFTYTGRYNYHLLGSAIKRTRPLTREIVLSHLASIPGTGVCEKFFSQAACSYADWYGTFLARDPDLTTCEEIFSREECAYAIRYGATDLSGQAMVNLLNSYPENERAEANFRLALLKVSEHPFRFAFFTVIESFKMFFWESTRIGYVRYPPWLDGLFQNTAVRYGIRFTLSLLTIAAYFYLLIFCLRYGKEMFDIDAKNDRERTAFLILIVLSVFLGVYGATCVLTRYALPITGLYLLSIALFLDRVLFSPKTAH